MNILVHIAFVVIFLLAIFLRKDIRVIRHIFVLFIAIILGYGSLHALTAYRDISPPEGAAREAWVDGCLALQHHIRQTYIPVFVIYGFALIVLAFLPEQTANGMLRREGARHNRAKEEAGGSDHRT